MGRRNGAPEEKRLKFLKAQLKQHGASHPVRLRVALERGELNLFAIPDCISKLDIQWANNNYAIQSSRFAVTVSSFLIMRCILETEDKAERLHSLIKKLEDISVDTSAAQEHGFSQSASVHPLWLTMNMIAMEMGLQDDMALRNAFRSLCTSVSADIANIPIRKESVRSSWLARVGKISQVFDSDNFPHATKDVFQKHFTAENLEALDAISERFRSTGLQESSPQELEAALGAVREVIEALKKSGDLDTRIAAVLAHYVQQMEAVHSQAHDFGDEIFWRVYKETFATFAQIHPIIAEMENSEEIKRKLQVVLAKLASKSIVGVSLGANVATLATSLYPLLGGG